MKLAPFVIFIGFLGTNVFLVGEDLDPIYLFMKYFPLIEEIIRLAIGLHSDLQIRDHWLLYPSRVFVTLLGCILFWAIVALFVLAITALIIFVHDMMNYLIAVATLNGEQPIPWHLIKVIVKRYKETQIFVRNLNNLVRAYVGRWLMCINVLSISLSFASIRFLRTMDFLYIIYMPMLSLLMYLGTYIFLGIFAELALLPEQLIRECGKRVRSRRIMRVLHSLYKFRLKLDHVNIRRCFIPAYFKNCLDNITTLLLSSFGGR